jgi:RNA polymerase sigma factor (TIGR02999 family)
VPDTARTDSGWRERLVSLTRYAIIRCRERHRIEEFHDFLFSGDPMTGYNVNDGMPEGSSGGPVNLHRANELMELVYRGLRKLAEKTLANEPGGQALRATSLVHEAYLRIAEDPDAKWDSPGHFFAAAAEALRRILVERARRDKTIKHGGGRKRIRLTTCDAPVGEAPIDVLELHEALLRLEQIDQRMSDVVKLRFFAGLTVDQTAQAMNVAARTVNREWLRARAWLINEIDGDRLRSDGDGHDQ